MKIIREIRFERRGRSHFFFAKFLGFEDMQLQVLFIQVFWTPNSNLGFDWFGRISLTGKRRVKDVIFNMIVLIDLFNLVSDLY